MRRYLAVGVLLLALTGCGSYVQAVKEDGVVCIVQRREWNNTVQSVKCPRPFVTNK